MTPWLSVIMPIHNGQRFLQATLESVSREQPEGVEILFLDTSNDLTSSRRIAEEFSGLLDISFMDANGLVSWTDKTNLGVASARADYISMLHQDDLWLPGHVTAVRKAISAAPECGLCIGPSLFINDRGEPIGHWRLPFPLGIQAPETFLAKLIVQNTIAVPSAVIRRDLWIKCGGLKSKLWYTADWDLYLELAAIAPVFVRQQETTAFRIHKSSQTVSGARDAEAFRQQLQSTLDHHLPALPAHLQRRAGPLARASIEMNCAMAGAAHGRRGGIPKAIISLLKLGPSGIADFLNQSRLLDRVIPRLRTLGPR